MIRKLGFRVLIRFQFFLKFCRKQERLDFLYDSGLAVGKGASSSAAGGSGGGGFKALEEALPGSKAGTDGNANQSSAPGALFEDKPHSANDAWRKLHSDPLLMIRQREQEALARIKNNPVQMAMIRKSVCYSSILLLLMCVLIGFIVNMILLLSRSREPIDL